MPSSEKVNGENVRYKVFDCEILIQQFLLLLRLFDLNYGLRSTIKLLITILALLFCIQNFAQSQMGSSLSF